MPYAPTEDDDFFGGIGTAVGGQDPSGGGGGYQGTGAQGMGNFGADPFGYTGGSLLTPWTQQFQAPPGSYGGGGGISMDPFKYADFAYNYNAPGAYGGQQDATADKFGYAGFQSPAAFQAPTEADLQQDPSFKLRQKAGQDALINSQAARGIARSGGALKALSDYAGESASQEYGNVYGRKKGEYDTAAGLARQDYDRNRANAADVSNTNFRRGFDVNQANNQSRLAAYNANADTSLRGQELGYNISSGTYDRNRQNAQDAYNSAMQIAQSNASAGRANADDIYNRALNEYKMNYDIFQNNQNTQWDRLGQMTGIGMGAAGQQANYGDAYGDRLGGAVGQGANAQAGGIMGKAAGTAGMFDAIGQGAATAYDAYLGQQEMNEGNQAPRPISRIPQSAARLPTSLPPGAVSSAQLYNQPATSYSSLFGGQQRRSPYSGVLG